MPLVLLGYILRVPLVLLGYILRVGLVLLGLSLGCALLWLSTVGLYYQGGFTTVRLSVAILLEGAGVPNHMQSIEKLDLVLLAHVCSSIVLFFLPSP